jgi:hypothetical protein
MYFTRATLVIGLLSAPAFAVPSLDGSKDAEYGAALAVQTLETQFGDANPNGGSELDAAYAKVEGGVLYLMLTGNLENNFNKLNIFIDSVAGGQNVLQNDANNGGTNPENDNWAGKHAGMTFDTGFDADFLITLRNGNFGGDRFQIDFATIGGGLGAFQAADDIFGGTLTGANAAALANGTGVAFNNSNVAGVAGGTGAADQTDAQAVLTGIELAIPLAAIGSPVGDIRISAMINGSNHDYLSNQFLAGLPTGLLNGVGAGTGNLGGDGNGGFNGTVGQIDFNDYAGNQYFAVDVAVIPEPASATLAAIGIIALVARRQRSDRAA